ncbi:hypothetical protein CPB84DRAFT_1811525 [Gymnopilus junonius]|uniref:Uncharacterized protein n=1 Tax=Gymnopilus junonius TaxID=109634 RepID=A0A9P5P3D7_GYMJU|nr:hypothetical protein CPB84DRAFT_1811525 [Gymnopilus junonius]
MSRRAKEREDLDKAHEFQTKGAMAGAARSTGIGLGLVIMAHHLWPIFRRQTLAFKGFLVSGFTMCGLVFGAESALIKYENTKRRDENILRREARLDLARRGLIGTETEIANWIADRERQRQSSS